MAHFAQIDENNIVQQVIVVGIPFCKNLIGADTNWVRTSYNGNIRSRYASIGDKYDSTNDVFLSPPPFPSWVLNTSTWDWDAPVALPDDAGIDDADNPTESVRYDWDEDSTSWTNRTVIDLT